MKYLIKLDLRRRNYRKKRDFNRKVWVSICTIMHIFLFHSNYHLFDTKFYFFRFSKNSTLCIKCNNYSTFEQRRHQHHNRLASNSCLHRCMERSLVSLLQWQEFLHRRENQRSAAKAKNIQRSSSFHFLCCRSIDVQGKAKEKRKISNKGRKLIDNKSI